MTAASVVISERAARRIGEILKTEGEGAMLRISVEGGGCSGFQYKFDIERARAEDDLVLARDHQVIFGLVMVDVEFVLEAGAAAALDGDAQHGAVALGLEDLPDAAGGPLADGDGSGHESSPVDGVIPISFGIPQHPT